MKKIILFLFIIVSIEFNSQIINEQKAEDYFTKTKKCGLFSPLRQRYLDSAILFNHKHSYYWQQKAMPLFKQKKYELGMQYLDSAVKYDNTNHWREYRAFIKCIFQKSYRSAIQDFEFVKSKNEDGNVMDHTFNMYIGLCYLQLNEFENAAVFIQKSINYREKKWGNAHHLEYFYLGITYMELEQIDKSHQYLDSAIKYYSHFPDAKFYKSRLYLIQGEKEKADKYFQEAKNDLDKGYTINEDNAIYEEYPYQIKPYWLKM